MASEADRLQAERLFIEEGASPSDICRTLNVARSTVYKWRDEGNWENRRREYADKIGQHRTAAALDAAASFGVERVLSRLEGLAIVAEVARSATVEPRDRLAAVKLAASIEGWDGASGDEGDGPPVRFVVERPRRG